ncbi:MAG: hypothetical protein ACREUL_18565 [Steroidobacteraceae bacterium]
MTLVGAGGVTIKRLAKLRRFERDYLRLGDEYVDKKLKDLLQNPMPPGLRFEKLKGYSNPDIYTIHVTGNIKISMSIDGSVATLRRLGTHDEIGRNP